MFTARHFLTLSKVRIQQRMGGAIDVGWHREDEATFGCVADNASGSKDLLRAGDRRATPGQYT